MRKTFSNERVSDNYESMVKLRENELKREVEDAKEKHNIEASGSMYFFHQTMSMFFAKKNE